jgi:hypothetical protein
VFAEAIIIVAVPSVSAFAEPTEIERALEAITNTADRVCSVVQQRGLTERGEVHGEVKAEVEGLLKRLANLGFSGGGSAEKSTYEGLQQSDLAGALQNNAQCKLQVFQLLQEKLIPSISNKRGGIPEKPLSLTLVSSATQPLDGYHFTRTPAMPANLAQGITLPGGGRTRVSLQALDPDSIVEIDKVSLRIERQDIDTKVASYAVDPTRQPGFGAARPRRFYIRLEGANRAQAFYMTDKNVTQPVNVSNLLAGTDFPLLRLDRTVGLQETLDFTLVAIKPGIYGIRFVAHATSGGKEYELETPPLYIIGH